MSKNYEGPGLGGPAAILAEGAEVDSDFLLFFSCRRCREIPWSCSNVGEILRCYVFQVFSGVFL